MLERCELTSIAVGRLIGQETAIDAVRRFLHLTLSTLPDRPADSVVGYGAPLEYSLTSRDDALRVLVDPVSDSATMQTRLIGASEVFSRLATTYGGPSLGSAATAFIGKLLPLGADVGRVQWRAVLWAALRATGNWQTVRVYVNVRFQPPLARLERCRRACADLDKPIDDEIVRVVRHQLINDLEIVGISVDIQPGGIVPSRLHCRPNSISVRVLQQLLGAAPDREAVEQILFLCETLKINRYKPRRALLSIALNTAESPLKVDVTVRHESRNHLQTCCRTLAARFGAIAHLHEADRLFRREGTRSKLQYIGASFDHRGATSWNVYYGLCGERGSSAASESTTISDAINRGMGFLHRYITARSIGVPMEAKAFGGPLRPVPKVHGDVYLSALLLQELKPIDGRTGEIEAALEGFLERTSESGFWRYLPDLPLDLDDTSVASMALSLRPQGRNALRQIARMQQLDGGFPTFMAQQSQRSHPLVTVNVAQCLKHFRVPFNEHAARGFLAKWIESSEFPDCEWSCSPLFNAFLCARSALIQSWFPDELPHSLDEVVTRVLEPPAQRATLNIALAVLLLPSYRSRHSAADYLISRQESDGGWGWEPYYSDGAFTLFGSRAFTSAIVLRALSILSQRQVMREPVRSRVRR